MKMNNNDNEFNAMNGNNLVSVYELISTYGMEAMPQAMEILFNEAMLVDRTQHLGVGHYERSNNRLDYANGYKPKRVKTRIGELDLLVPQTRNSDFYPNCLEKGLHSERALNIALSEMYVNGVSTSRVSKIIKSMCGASVSLQMETPALIQYETPELMQGSPVNIMVMTPASATAQRIKLIDIKIKSQDHY